MLQNDEWIDHWSNFLLSNNQGCKFLAAKNRKIRDPIAQNRQIRDAFAIVIIATQNSQILLRQSLHRMSE